MKRPYYPNPYANFDVGYDSVPLKSMKRDDILTYLYNIRLIPWYVSYLLRQKHTNTEVQEYCSEIWIQICEKTQEAWDKLKDKEEIIKFASKIILLNCKSKTSPAYYRVRKENEKYVHIRNKDWESFDEEGKLPDYLKDIENESVCKEYN